MIVSLDVKYHSQYLFLPVRRGDDSLLGVELIADFISDNASVRIPPGFVLSRITAEQRLILFYEAISLLEQHREFFIQNQVLAWVSVDEIIVSALLSGVALQKRVSELPFLEFSLTEDYPGLNAGKAHPQLNALQALHPLLLANYGSGGATSRAVYEGMYRRVKLDKQFINRQLSPSTFEPFISAIIKQISPCCDTLILPGIDNEIARRHAIALGVGAVQGRLWPPVMAASLASLIE